MKKWIKNIFLISLLISPMSVMALESSSVGMVQAYSGDGMPENYLLADGRAISRTEYAELFQVMGTKYGSGDGTSTFNLPNLNGRIAVGKSEEDEFDQVGKQGGEAGHVLTEEEIPSHTHEFIGSSHSHPYTSIEVTSAKNTLVAKASFTGSAVTSESGGSHYHQVRWLALTAGRNTGTATSDSSKPAFFRTGTSGSSLASTYSSGSHGHSMTSAGTVTLSNTAHSHTATATGITESSAAVGKNQNTGKNEAHNNMQPYIVMKYIIKVK